MKTEIKISFLSMFYLLIFLISGFLYDNFLKYVGNAFGLSVIFIFLVSNVFIFRFLYFKWLNQEVELLTEKAESGDEAAVSRLLEYYVVHENEKEIVYWENWLAKRGHRDDINGT